MSKELQLITQIKNNGLTPYKNIIPKYIVCFNCGLERPLNIWLKDHGNNCKLAKLNTERMS